MNRKLIDAEDTIRNIIISSPREPDEAIRATASAISVITHMPDARKPDMKCIELLSEVRSKYNCFYEEERPYYEALSKAISAMRGE